MRPSRVPAVATALLVALAAAGCGIGAGEGVGEATLTVTRDYGSRALVGPVSEEATESDTVMRLLDSEADIDTRYGGGFVSSIEGVSEGAIGGRRHDWFFYVDGIESEVGAADVALRGGERIWWDYRDWSTVAHVPAVVGSFPGPLAGGYGGRERPVAVECLGGGAACAEAGEKLREAGVEPAAGRPEGAIRVLVGPWGRLREDPVAGQIGAGPEQSGVFAQFRRPGDGPGFLGLDETGAVARSFGPGAGLVAATRRFGGVPVWVVTGATARGALAAAGELDADSLRERYALATEGGEETPLPVP